MVDRLMQERGQRLKEEALGWFKKIEPFYYSPLSSFAIELMNLKALFGCASITPSLSEPSTWRYINRQKFSNQEGGQLLKKVMSAYYYLAQGENLFSGEAALILQASFPYFEWPTPTKIASFTEGLGQWQIILLKRREQRSTLAAIKTFFSTHQLNFMGRILVIDDEAESIEEILAPNDENSIENDLLEKAITIKQRHLPSYDIEEENFIESRSLTSLFKGEPHALFINPYGLYEARAAKTEVIKFLQELFLPQAIAPEE